MAAGGYNGKSPFPSDPGYECTNGYYRNNIDTTQYRLDYTFRGRTRPEARDIASRHTNGIISRLLSNENHFSDTTRSTTKSKYCQKKKNHTLANKRRIREIQTRCQMRQREEEGDKESVSLIRPSTSYDKYHYVQPKVTSYSQKSISKDSSLQTVQSHEGRPCPSTAHISPDKSSMLKRNFLLENISQVSHYRPKQAPKETAIKVEQERKERKVISHKRGTVPQYLLERKEQWRIEEKERIAALPDPSIPEGHTLMPKQQRLETLETLQKHYEELMNEVQALSLTADTLRITSRRSQLESRLVEVEDAIKIFSKPKVFIKINE